LEEEFSAADARLVIDLLGISFAKDRGETPLAAKLYKTHSPEHINRVATQLLSVRLELATFCPLNFETAD
jgi:hypothetical protein